MEKFVKSIFKYFGSVVKSAIGCVLFWEVVKTVKSVIQAIKARINRKRAEERLQQAIKENEERKQKLDEMRQERARIEADIEASLKEVQEQIEKAKQADSNSMRAEFEKTIRMAKRLGVSDERIIHDDEEGEEYFTCES